MGSVNIMEKKTDSELSSEELLAFTNAGMPAYIKTREEAMRWREGYMELTHMNSRPKWTIPWLGIFEVRCKHESYRKKFKIVGKSLIDPSQDHDAVLKQFNESSYPQNKDLLSPGESRFYAIFQTVARETHGVNLGENVYFQHVLGENLMAYDFDDVRWRYYQLQHVEQLGWVSYLQEKYNKKEATNDF